MACIHFITWGRMFKVRAGLFAAGTEKTENRKQRTEYRKQNTESRIQETGDRRQKRSAPGIDPAPNTLSFSVFCILSSVFCLLTSVFCLLHYLGERNRLMRLFAAENPAIADEEILWLLLQVEDGAKAHAQGSGY